MPDKLLVWLYALGAYGLALIGAVGIAWILKLDFRTSLILTGGVAVIALFGSFIPILRLGYARLNAKRPEAEGTAAAKRDSRT